MKVRVSPTEWRDDGPTSAHARHPSFAALPVAMLSDAVPVLSPGMYSDQQRRKARRAKRKGAA
jgi:hypothetical protein